MPFIDPLKASPVHLLEDSVTRPSIQALPLLIDPNPWRSYLNSLTRENFESNEISLKYYSLSSNSL